MATIDQIGKAFAERLIEGPESLKDANGASGAIEMPMADGNTVELGVNPHSGFFLRLRVRLEHASGPQREALMGDLVRLTASARFRAGWVGGCEAGNVLTLAAPLHPDANGSSIACLIETARSLLVLGNVEGRQHAIEESLSIGENWLRI